MPNQTLIREQRQRFRVVVAPNRLVLEPHATQREPDGVLDESKRLCPELTAADCRRLIADGVATGGMQAKLNAATAALRQGVGQVRIAPGSAPDALARLLAGESLGTRLV